MKTTRESRETYSQAVRAAKERVRRLPLEQLRDLFDDGPIHSATSDLPVGVAIIRDRHEASGGILVVMQAFRPSRWFRRLSSVFLDGFILHPDGTITDADDDDLSPYD